MEVKSNSVALVDDLKVLVIGNNPIELSRVFDNLNSISGKKLITEIAFDFKSIRERLQNFKPNFILIDDNIDKIELKSMIQSLNRRRTKNIPITILKNSNYSESATSGVMNFLLKDNLTSEALYKSFLDVTRFKKTHEYLANAYHKRKGQLVRLLKP